MPAGMAKSPAFEKIDSGTARQGQSIRGRAANVSPDQDNRT